MSDDRFPDHDDPGPVDPAGPLARRLRDEAIWVEPPLQGADRLVAAVRTEAASGARPRPPGSGARPRRPRWQAVAAAAVAVGVVGAGLVGVLRQGTSAPDDGPPDLVLAGTDLAPGASASAVVDEQWAGTAIRLEVADLGGAPPGTYYQGWVDGPRGMVAVGTFHLRDGDTVYLWSGVDLESYPRMVVTRQDEGGGPGPSDDVLLVGEIVP